jgi:hypothetical protein
MIGKANKLMPAANPPKVFRSDNIEWSFLRTFANHGQLRKFLCESHCKIGTRGENIRRVRLTCCRKRSNNCEYQLLALKTTKQGYHVYKIGEHNHPVHKPKSKCEQILIALINEKKCVHFNSFCKAYISRD